MFNETTLIDLCTLRMKLLHYFA